MFYHEKLINPREREMKLSTFRSASTDHNVSATNFRRGMLHVILQGHGHYTAPCLSEERLSSLKTSNKPARNQVENSLGFVLARSSQGRFPGLAVFGRSLMNDTWRMLPIQYGCFTRATTLAHERTLFAFQNESSDLRTGWL